MFQYITSNVKSLVRSDSMAGKDYLVGPMVMINEGVHHGDGGPIFYPASELKKGLTTWNHRPVVVYHPVQNGRGISACGDPVELTKRKIGITMATNYDTESKSVKGEAWLEPDRLPVVDERVAEAVQNQQMMELSTGLYMNVEAKEGTWNGEPYVGVARNLVLDHLAVLPDIPGACSIADGAGFLRLNADGSGKVLTDEIKEKYLCVIHSDLDYNEESLTPVWVNKSKGVMAIIGNSTSDGAVFRLTDQNKTVREFLFDNQSWDEQAAKAWAKGYKPHISITQVILNELSFDEKRALLSGTLRAKIEDAWIVETYDDNFIYETNGKTYRQKYKINKGAVRFTGIPTQVERLTTWKRVSVTNVKINNAKGCTMDKLVDELIANERTPWSAEDRDALLAMNEEKLLHLKEAGKEVEVVETPVDNTATPAKIVPEKTAEVPNENTVESFIANAPPEVAEAVTNAMASLKREKERHIEVITANEKNTFTPEYLLTKPVDELEALAKLAAPVVNEDMSRIRPLFNGQGQTPTVNNTTPKHEPLGQPKMEDYIKKTG